MDSEDKAHIYALNTDTGIQFKNAQQGSWYAANGYKKGTGVLNTSEYGLGGFIDEPGKNPRAVTTVKRNNWRPMTDKEYIQSLNINSKDFYNTPPKQSGKFINSPEFKAQRGKRGSTANQGGMQYFQNIPQNMGTDITVGGLPVMQNPGVSAIRKEFPKQPIYGKGGSLSPDKANEMLKNPPHGKPLTDKQRKYFQAVAHGMKPKYPMGGDMNPDQSDNGQNNLIEINGPKHEQGGVDFGPDAELEGGETVHADVVNSDQIEITPDIAEEYGLPNSSIGKTVADYSKVIERKYKGREVDPFAQTSREMEMNNISKMSTDLKERYDAMQGQATQMQEQGMDMPEYQGDMPDEQGQQMQPQDQQDQQQMRYGGRMRYDPGGPIEDNPDEWYTSKGYVKDRYGRWVLSPEAQETRMSGNGNYRNPNQFINKEQILPEISNNAPVINNQEPTPRTTSIYYPGMGPDSIGDIGSQYEPPIPSTSSIPTTLPSITKKPNPANKRGRTSMPNIVSNTPVNDIPFSQKMDDWRNKNYGSISPGLKDYFTNPDVIQDPSSIDTPEGYRPLTAQDDLGLPPLFQPEELNKWSAEKNKRKFIPGKGWFIQDKSYVPPTNTINTTGHDFKSINKDKTPFTINNYPPIKGPINNTIIGIRNGTLQSKLSPTDISYNPSNELMDIKPELGSLVNTPKSDVFFNNVNDLPGSTYNPAKSKADAITGMNKPASSVTKGDWANKAMGLAPIVMGGIQALRTLNQGPDVVKTSRMHAEDMNPALLDPSYQLQNIGDTFATGNEQMNQVSKNDYLRRRIQSATEEARAKSGVLGQVGAANTQMLNQAKEFNIQNRMRVGQMNMSAQMNEANINAGNRGAWQTASDYQLSNLGTMLGQRARDIEMDRVNKENMKYQMDVMAGMYKLYGMEWDPQTRSFINMPGTGLRTSMPPSKRVEPEYDPDQSIYPKTVNDESWRHGSTGPGEAW
jgi:hypothetical protein